jgi:hypothetical protein
MSPVAVRPVFRPLSGQLDARDRPVAYDDPDSQWYHYGDDCCGADLEEVPGDEGYHDGLGCCGGDLEPGQRRVQRSYEPGVEYR